MPTAKLDLTHACCPALLLSSLPKAPCDAAGYTPAVPRAPGAHTPAVLPRPPVNMLRKRLSGTCQVSTSWTDAHAHARLLSSYDPIDVNHRLGAGCAMPHTLILLPFTPPPVRAAAQALAHTATCIQAAHSVTGHGTPKAGTHRALAHCRRCWCVHCQASPL